MLTNEQVEVNHLHLTLYPILRDEKVIYSIGFSSFNIE